MHAHLSDNDRRLLRNMLAPHTSPVAVLDFARIGGATFYSQSRVRDFLAGGHSVLHLVCRKDGSLAANALYKELVFECRLDGLHELMAPDAPPLPTILVNELVDWTLPESARTGYEAVGTGRARWIPAVVSQVAALTERHASRLEVAVHDFLAVCPNFTLLNDRQQRQYCGVPSMAACRECLASPWMRASLGGDFSLEVWRAAWQGLFSRSRRILCFSASSREILSRAFDFAGNRAVVVPHKSLLPDAVPLSLPKADRPMKVALAGKLSAPKGAGIVQELAALMRERIPEAEMVIFGTVTADLALPPNVLVTGEYEHRLLPSLVLEHKPTVGFISSVWPETYSYVTQELMALGLPLVCFPLGAPAERVGAWEHGLVAGTVTAEAALAALVELDARRSASA